MQKYLRYLRIAFSATCLIACVLLIVLWVRSYWLVTTAYLPFTNNREVRCVSTSGSVWIGSPTYGYDQYPSHFYEVPSHAWKQPLMLLTMDDGIAIPYWLLVVISVVPAAFPWIRWRFSLRTLLFATTLVAVVLGLIVYLLR